jgi:RecB family exonuclease
MDNDKKDKRPQLHVSALNMLSKCGEMFRRRYIEGEKIPPGIALIVGTATHKSVETNLRGKIEKKDIPMAELEAVASDTLNAEWKKGIALTDEEKELGIKKAKGEAVDKAVKLSRAHAVQIAPGIHPISVERTWSLELAGFSHDLAGTIDIIESSTLRDTKTASKSPNEDTASRSIQLTAYSLAVKVLDGKAPEKVCLDYLVAGKNEVKTISLFSERKEEDYQALFRRIEMAMRVIKSGDFIPTSPDSWNCSPRFCGFYSSCKYVS